MSIFLHILYWELHLQFLSKCQKYLHFINISCRQSRAHTKDSVPEYSAWRCLQKQKIEKNLHGHQ